MSSRNQIDSKKQVKLKSKIEDQHQHQQNFFTKHSSVSDNLSDFMTNTDLSSDEEEAQSSQENTSSNKNNNDLEYTVEAVRSHRGVGASREYFIKWENYSEDENTWEPLTHLHNIKNMIKDYENKLKIQKPAQKQAPQQQKSVGLTNQSNSKDSPSDSKLIQLKKTPAAKTITKDSLKLLNQTSNLQAKNGKIDLSNATNILKDHNNSQKQLEKQENTISKENLQFGKVDKTIAATVSEIKQTSQQSSSLLAAVINGSMSKKLEKSAVGVSQGVDGGESIGSVSKNSSSSSVELGKRTHSQIDTLINQLPKDNSPIKKLKTNSNSLSSSNIFTIDDFITPGIRDPSLNVSISKSISNSNDSGTSNSLMQAILNKETSKGNQDGLNIQLLKKNGQNNNLMNMLLTTKPQQQQQQVSSSKLERMLAEDSPTKETNNNNVDNEISLIDRQNKELLAILEGESEMFKRQFALSANNNGKDGDEDDYDDDNDDDDDSYHKGNNKSKNNSILFDLQKDLVEFKGASLASIKASKASIQAVIIKELNQELFKKSRIASDVVSRWQIQESYLKFEYLVPFSCRNIHAKINIQKQKIGTEIKTKDNGLIQKGINPIEKSRQGENEDDGRIVAEELRQQVELVKRDSMAQLNPSSSITADSASQPQRGKGNMIVSDSDRIISEELNKKTNNQSTDLLNPSNTLKKNIEINMNGELVDNSSKLNGNTINASTTDNPNKLVIAQAPKQQDLNNPLFEQPSVTVNPLIINNNPKSFSDPFPNMEKTTFSSSQKIFQSEEMNQLGKMNFSNSEKVTLNQPEPTNQKVQIKENLRDLNITSLEEAKQIEEQRILEEIINKKRRIDSDTPIQISSTSSFSQQPLLSSSLQSHNSTRPSESANPGQEKTSLLSFISPKDIQEKKSDNLQSLKSSQEQELNQPSIQNSNSKFSDPSQPPKAMDSVSLKHSTSSFSSQPYLDGYSIKSSSRHENSRSPSRKKEHKHKDKDSKSSRRSGRSRDRNRSSSKAKKDKKSKKSSNVRSRSRSPSMRIAPKRHKNSVSRSRSSSSLRISKNSSTQLGTSQTTAVKNGVTSKTINESLGLPAQPGPVKKSFNPFHRNTIYDEDEDDDDQTAQSSQTTKSSSNENTKDKHKNEIKKGLQVVKMIDQKNKDDDIWDDGDDDICSTSDKNSSSQRNNPISYNVNPYDDEEDYSKPSVNYQQQQQNKQQDNKSALNNSSFRRESGFDQYPKYAEKSNNIQNSYHDEYSINETQGSGSYNKSSNNNNNNNNNNNLNRHDSQRNDGFVREDKEVWPNQQKSYQQYSDKENYKSNDNINYNKLKDDQGQGPTKQDLTQYSKPKEQEEKRNISTSIESKPSESVETSASAIPSKPMRDPRLVHRSSEQQKDTEKQLREFEEKQQNILKQLGEIGCPMLDAPARISQHLVWNNQMFFKVIWKPRENKIQMPPTFIEFVKVQESYPNILNQYMLSSLSKQSTLK